MTYVFFVFQCYPYPIIKHLIDEGNEVLVGIVHAVPEFDNDETPSETSQRLAVYDGMVKKEPYKSVLQRLYQVPKSKQADYFVFFDFNDMYPIAEMVTKMGFKNGLFPTKFYYEIEKNRERAKEWSEAYYPEV